MSKDANFPMLSPVSWWKLRKKFNTTIPKSEINKSYLATALDISEASARTNILPKLRMVGLVDENGKVTALALRWRNNDEYKTVCEELIATLYPHELLEAIDDPLSNKDRVIRWFQSKAKVGEEAAKKMTSFYLLLLDGDFTKQDEAVNVKQDKQKAEKPRVEVKTASQKTKAKHDDSKVTEEAPLPAAKQTVSPPANSNHSFNPSLHIDIQIHISPESSPEQIDKIFASMAKHLSGFKLQ